MNMQHFIKGIEIYPVNGDEIGFSMNFGDDVGQTTNELNIDTVVLAREAKKIVLDHINNGAGVTEGIPYEVRIGNVSVDYYVDLLDNPKLSGEGDSTIEISIKKRKSWKYFKENADVLSFEAINKTNAINTVKVPYVIIKENQVELIIMLSLSIYALVRELIQSIRDLNESIVDLIKAVTPNVGVPPSIDLGDVIGAVLKVIMRLVFVIAILAALINLGKQIFDIMFPPKHYLKGSTILELMNKGCAKLGYTFQSSILNNLTALTIVPVPLIDNNKSIWQTNFASAFQTSFNKGYPTASDTTSTLGSLVDALVNMFNARIKVDNGVVKMERRDFWLTTSANSITNTLNLQAKRENQFTYNTGDVWKRYYIHYQVDFSDMHTLDNVDGTDAEYSTEQSTITNADLVNIKGLADVSIPFAFGARKKELNLIEKFAKPVASLFDKVTGVLGGGTNFVSDITGKIGVMKISQQHFTTTKLLYLVGEKQPSNYLSFIRASKLWADFHSINKVKENFNRIYSATIPFSSNDFEALQGQNYVLDGNGDLLELLSLEFINNNKTAQIEYQEVSDEFDNTNTIVIRG